MKELQAVNRRVERERERIRKEREREEAARLKKEKREAADRERQAKRDRENAEKEAKRLEREAERARKEKERDEERAKKEKEREAREEERAKREKEREEERARKEEEKRRKEAEQRREEAEKERKAERQRAILMGFLVKESPDKAAHASEAASADENRVATHSAFMQFELKKDQRMAPLWRIADEERRKKKRANVDEYVAKVSEAAESGAPRLGLSKFGQPNDLRDLRTVQLEPRPYPASWPM